MHEAHIRVLPLPRPQLPRITHDPRSEPAPERVQRRRDVIRPRCYLRWPGRPLRSCPALGRLGRQGVRREEQKARREDRAREARAEESPERAAVATAAPRKNQALLVTGPRLLWKRTPRPSVGRLPRSWLARALERGAIPAVIGGSERAWPAGRFVSALVSLVRLLKAFTLRKNIALCVVPESLNRCHPGGEERSVPSLLTLDRKMPSLLLLFCRRNLKKAKIRWLKTSFPVYGIVSGRQRFPSSFSKMPSRSQMTYIKLLYILNCETSKTRS